MDGIIYGMGTTATDATIMMLAPGDDVRGQFASGIIGTPMTQINRLADAYGHPQRSWAHDSQEHSFAGTVGFLSGRGGVIRKKPKQ